LATCAINYNAKDYALGWWEVNNKQRPDGVAGYAFSYGGATNLYDETVIPLQPLLSLDGTDKRG